MKKGCAMKRNVIFLVSLIGFFFLLSIAQQEDEAESADYGAESEEPMQQEEAVEPEQQPDYTQMQQPDVAYPGLPAQQAMADTAGQMPSQPMPPAETAPAPLTIEATEQEEGEEAGPATEEKPVDYGEGVDTLTISGSGNWLLKRVWWEKGQSKFESIKAVLEKIFDSRMDFFFKRSTIDKELNAFYLEIGFAQGELDEILQNLIEMIERQPEEAVNDAEREMLARLHKNKKDLEQLKQDIANVAEIDGAIDAALTQMIDQINKCRKYEHEAWLRFKAIAQEIDDEKARELYYHMETLQENMQDVYTYLRGEFAQYFNDLLEKAREHMARVKTTIADLKEKDIALEKRVEAAVNEQPMPEEQPVEEPIAKKPKKGFAKIVAGITGFIKQIVKTIVKAVKRMGRAIMAAVRGTKAKKVPVQEVEVSEIVSEPVTSPTPVVPSEQLEPMPPAPEPQEELPAPESATPEQTPEPAVEPA